MMALLPVSRRRALLTGAALSALLLPGLAGVVPASAQAVANAPVTAQAAPEDSVFFLSVDLDEGSDQWTQAQELLTRMGLPNALDEARSALREDPMSAGRISDADLDALLGGEMAIVVLPQAAENLREFAEAAIDVSESGALATPGALEDSVAVEAAFGEAFATPLAELSEVGYGVAAVLEPSDLDAAWDYVETQLRQAATESGGEVDEVDYNGTTILVAPIAKDHGNETGLGGNDATSTGTPIAGTSAEASPDADDTRTTGDELDELGGVGPGRDETVGGDPTGAEFGGDELEAMGFDGPGQIVAARAGDFILTAGTAADLEPLIDTATGDGPSLAESDDLAAVRDEFATDEELLFAYVSGPELWAGLGDELAARIDELSASMYAGMDLDAYRDAHQGIAIWADEPGLRVDTVTLRTDGQPLPPLVPDAAAIDFAGRVPANTVLYSAGTVARQQLDAVAFGIAQIVNQGMGGAAMTEPETLDDVLAMFTPEYAEAQLAGAEDVLGFNLQADFTDLLTGEFGLAIGTPQFAGSAFGIDAVLSLPSTDAAALADTTQEIARLAEGMAGGALSARREGEDTLYVVQDSNASGTPAFEFGVIGDELLAGTDTGLESYQQGPTASLADDEQFLTVMGLLPEDGYQDAYVNLGQIIELVQSLSGPGGFTGVGPEQDADVACAEYADQAEAQAALEADSLENAALDSDFDGQACEDFFGAASTPVAVAGGPQNVRALGIVAWERDGKQGTNTLLYVTDDAS